MENIKSKIIPNSMKKDIDVILEQQLFNANRYYAESNPKISELMNKELLNGPEVFLKRLRDRWDWHNLFYELLLEPSFTDIVRNREKELSPTEIDELIRIFSTSCCVDEATLVMSGAIKKYLDYNCKFISTTTEDINKEDASQFLITPPIETFFAQYQIDHLFYIYLIKFENEKSSSFKKKLLYKYHAGDDEIFNSRFKKRFEKYLKLNMSRTELLKEIKQYCIPNEYKVKHFYFTLEHPERRAIRDIIIYDNLNEKLIASNLIGISGFLLRKKILDYLNESEILKNNGFIYEYNKEIIVSALEKLKEERKCYMDKNVKPYKQRGDTCAICCMMMVLEYFGVIEKANWYDERRFYRIYGSKYMNGTPFSAIAYHFSKSGLVTNLYHEDENLFNNKKKALSSQDFDFAMDEYKSILNRAQLKGTNIVNGIKIDSKLIKQELEDGKLVVLAGEISGGYHAVLITGYEDEKFIVCDPLFKNKQVRSAEVIDKFMNTSIGKWFISVKNNSKNKDNLLMNLDEFQKTAIDMMNIVKENDINKVRTKDYDQK